MTDYTELLASEAADMIRFMEPLKNQLAQHDTKWLEEFESYILAVRK